MKHLKTILVITTIMISSCATVPPQPTHPELMFPTEPDLPKFTRAMLDCGNHNQEDLPLCIRIKEREETLRYYIGTLQDLINTHNSALQ